MVAPPGNQAANGENKPQPTAMGGPSLLDFPEGLEHAVSVQGLNLANNPIPESFPFGGGLFIAHEIQSNIEGL